MPEKSPPTHYGVVHYDKSQQCAKRFSAAGGRQSIKIGPRLLLVLHRHIVAEPVAGIGTRGVGGNIIARVGEVLYVEDQSQVGDSKRSHIAVAALNGLPDRRRRDLIRDLDVPDFTFTLRGEVSEQLRNDRYIAYLVAA
jgi:hypothetical protein